MTSTHRKWVLAARPDGIPGADCFELQEAPLAEPGDGEVQVEMLYISIDPGMRSRLSGDSYSAALGLGEVIESAGIGRVLKSNADKFAAGDLVMAGSGWQSHLVSKPRGLVKLQEEMFQGPLTPTAAIGVLGIPGLTAYFGLLDLGQPKDGETVLVSSAAGTVGATTGQLAKLQGLRAVGIAGSDEKCNYLKELGFDAAINYKAVSSLEDAVHAACPDGVDIFLDNVGGATLDAGIANMNMGGRIIISGAVSEYNRPEPMGIRNTLQFITHRLRMEGLVVFDYAREFPKAQAEMAGWILEGRLKYREIIDEGLENAPASFAALFNGAEDYGRRIIKI